MEVKWTVLALLLFTSLPLLNALPANLSFSQPSTLFVEEDAIYYANYTTTNESGSEIFLTPSEHNASCAYVYDENYSFAFAFNASTQSYELTIAYPSVANYSFTVLCSSNDFDAMSIENATQEVLPAPTSFSTFISTSNTTATLRVNYYSELKGHNLTPEENNAQCNASVYENDTGELAVETELTYNNDSQAFQETVELDPGTGYYWEVECSAEPNFESASDFSENDFYIDEASCEQVEVTSDLTLSQGKTCSNDGSAATPLFVISTDNVTLDCNGATLSGVGSNSGGRMAITANGVSNVNILNCNADGFSWPIWASNSNNVSFRNLSVASSGNSVIIVSSNNTIVDNFTFTGGGASSIYIYSSENTTISNGLIFDYDVAFFTNGNNTSITNVTVNDAYIGLEDTGNTTATNLLFNNTYLALLLSGSGSVLQNVSVYNSPFSPDLEATVAIGSNNTVASISVYNSSRDAVWLGGFNNSLAISASNVNGTALNLIEAINNSINLTLLSNNVLDLNITDFSNTTHGNVFNGNFASAFFNVSNANSVIATLNNLVLSANASTITINLTISSSTGTINLTNLVNYFNLSNNSVNLNSTLYSFLSQPAIITFSGVSYANNSVYEVLRDGTVCSDSICTKISFSPASFKVTGFSNYSTRLIPVAAAANNPSTTSTATSGSASAPATGTASTTQTAIANTTDVQIANSTNNSQVAPSTVSQTQQPPNEQNITTSDAPAQPTPFTGLFAGIPKELNNPYAVGAGVAIITLLAAGYFYFSKKH